MKHHCYVQLSSKLPSGIHELNRMWQSDNRGCCKSHLQGLSLRLLWVHELLPPLQQHMLLSAGA
jgi:hypothetical protein